MKNTKQKETKPFDEKPDEEFEVRAHPIESIAQEAVEDVMNHFLTVSAGWNKMEAEIKNLRQQLAVTTQRFAFALQEIAYLYGNRGNIQPEDYGEFKEKLEQVGK